MVSLTLLLVVAIAATFLPGAAADARAGAECGVYVRAQDGQGDSPLVP